MALLSAYATAAQYRAAVGDKASATDATLDAQLLTISRLLEKAMSLAPGAFNSASSQTLIFDGKGGTQLRFRDDAGLQYFVQSVASDGIGIDTEDDGTYDGYALDLNDAWVAGFPANAAAMSEPYRGIELLSYLGTCNPTSWPYRKRAVRISCTTGWASVPQVIQDLVIHRAQEWREALKSGQTRDLPSFDGGIPMSATTSWEFREAERLYGARMPI